MRAPTLLISLITSSKQQNKRIVNCNNIIIIEELLNNTYMTLAQAHSAFY